MALRGKKPETVTKRLKLMMYGPAGVGKTTAAIAFPRAYIVDTERGTENYGPAIEAANSLVFRPIDVEDLIKEVRSLLVERHDYRTLVIDPITTLYNGLLDSCEAKVGSDHGRHYGAAAKYMSRLSNLLTALDMNVIMTAHAKKEYNQQHQLLGQTFDGWRQLDYLFDLVLELSRDKAFTGQPTRAKGRWARVVKTRINTFPDGEVFEWSYQAVKDRYDAATLERQAEALPTASPEQVAELLRLLEVVRLPEGMAEKWLAAAKVDTWEDMSAYAIGKCIEHVRGKLQPAGNGQGGK